MKKDRRGRTNRRDFVKTGTVAAVAAGVVAGCSSAPEEPAAPTASHQAEVPDPGPGRSRSPGSPFSYRYQAEVPDTLDLAARGALALRSLTDVADPRFF